MWNKVLWFCVYIYTNSKCITYNISPSDNIFPQKQRWLVVLLSWLGGNEQQISCNVHVYGLQLRLLFNLYNE